MTKRKGLAPADDPRELQRHMSRFLTWYLPVVMSCSDNTVKSYRQTFKLFFRYMLELGKRPHELAPSMINAETVGGFVLWLEGTRGNAAGSTNVRLATFRSFCSYLEFEAPELVGACSGVLALKTKKVPRKTIQYLGTDAVKAILDAAGASSYRDYVLIQLMYDSAARVGEIAALTPESFLFSNLERSGIPSRVRLTGKGNRSRMVIISQQTTANMKNYLKRPDCLEGPGIFASRRGGALTRDGIAGILDKHVKTAREAHPELFPKWKVTPHTLRHSRATHWLSEGLTLEQVRDLLGHRFIATTEIYAEVTKEDVKEAVLAMNEKVLSGTTYEITNQDELDAWFAATFKAL